MQQMWVSTVVFQECFLYSSAADYGRVRSCVQRGDQHDYRRRGGRAQYCTLLQSTDKATETATGRYGGPKIPAPPF